MLPRRATFISVTAALGALLGIWLASSPDSSLTRAELNAQDLLARNGRHTPPNPQLVFLAIDAGSIALDAKADLQGLFGIEDATTPEGRALTAMSESWPWPRRVYAEILDRLVAAGARAVVFDLNFPTASTDDPIFRAALERHAGHVVIGSNFTTSNPGQEDVIGAALTLPSPTLLPQTAEADARVGYVNFWPDADGVIRNAQFQTRFGQFVGVADALNEPAYISLAAQAVRKAGHPEKVPADGRSHTFRYTAGPEEGFPPRSVFEIFVPEYWARNYRSGAVFEGAIVMVGASGNWQHDEHLTPFGMMPGPEIQLNVINALLHGEFIRPISRLSALGLWVLAGVGAAAASIFCRPPVWRIGLLLALIGGWAAAQLPLFDRLGLVGPIVGPMAVIAITGLVSLIHDLALAGAEQLRLHRSLSERKRIQEVLESSNLELERRVGERTAELTRANSNLTGLLGEKDLLLKEIHHRVKNNLQVISSLLNLQSGYISDPQALACFTDSRNRVRSMALVHEKLYQSGDLAQIDFRDYASALAGGLRASFGGRSSSVRIEVDVEQVMLGVDAAVPCGLIINELITNSFKYAFRDVEAPEIRISMQRNEKDLRLTVADNGVGFPKDLDIRNTESLGMQLVTTLTDQLEGTIVLRNGVGTAFDITFPNSPQHSVS